MNLITLNRTILPEWAAYLPEELFVSLMHGTPDLHALGVTFSEQNVGAICWSQTSIGWTLHSIYITREARRLGLGYELLAQLIRQMKEQHCPQLSLTYEPEGERNTLTPFFINCGISLETVRIPTGSVCFSEALTALEERNADKKHPSFQTLMQLSKHERYLCSKWFAEKTGEQLHPYFAPRIDSFVLLRDAQVQGMLLFREQPHSLQLSYCWIAPEQRAIFLPFLYKALRQVSATHLTQPVLEMLLATEQSQQLYERLLGSPTAYTTLITGQFSASEPFLPHLFEKLSK